jgi:hypothetical protein
MVENKVRKPSDYADYRLPSLGRATDKMFSERICLLTEIDVPPNWRHMGSVGQSVAPRPSRVNNKQASSGYKQLSTMDITAECMEHIKC